MVFIIYSLLIHKNWAGLKIQNYWLIDNTYNINAAW